MKNKSSHFLEILGVLATIIGALSFIPVLYTVWDTKKAHDFPFIGLVFALLSNLLWIYYGHFKSAKAPIFMGMLYVCIYGFILSVKTVYK